ncbi:MAG: hypothetical protein AB9891_17820 [Anaerolineaceae bacterium]
MRRLAVFLLAAGIFFPLVLIYSSIPTINAKAYSPSQQSCETDDCACEGYTPEQVWGQYKQRTLKEDSYYFYDYPSLCAEKYGDWVEPGTESMEDILRKVGYFLEEMAEDCGKCRGGSAPVVLPTETKEPSLELQPVQPPPIPTPTLASSPTPSPTPELPFPEIIVELEKAPNGDVYKGLVADGKSYLDIFVTNKDPNRQVVASFNEDSFYTMLNGQLLTSDGSDLSKKEFILPPGARSAFRYVAPANLGLSQIYSTEIILEGKDNLQTAYGIDAAVSFDFTLPESGASETRKLEFLLFRPPVQMVHGYLGSEGTWDTFARFLKEQRIDAVKGTYNPDTAESTIHKMAGILGEDIDRLLKTYRDKAIKITRVDVVTHSMGGLITRQYISSNPGEGIRKLIMLAAPNHGVDDWHRATRFLASIAFLGKHFIAGHQLNADNMFFTEINAFENEMMHLDPEVEYANIIGRASCGFKCPDDAVVPIASAHLNGVVEYIYDGVIHSKDLHSLPMPYSVIPWFSKSDVGIADSAPVMEKVLELLTNPIPRAAPDYAWKLVLQEGTGEIFISELSNPSQQTRNDRYPLDLSIHDRIRTGFSGQAVIILYLNGEEQKRVEMPAYSEVVFGITSPDTISLILQNGFARLTTKYSPSGEVEECDFDTTLYFEGSPPIPHAKVDVFDRGTDFILSAGEQYQVIVLDGSVSMDTYAPDGTPVTSGQILKADANQAITIASDGSFQPIAYTGESWWKDEFYGRTFPVPDWVAAERREPLNTQNPESLPSDISKSISGTSNPGIYLLAGSLCWGIFILVLFVVIVLVRNRKEGADRKAYAAGKGLMGVTGCLLAALIAGLVLACLGSITGLLWWQGIFKTPGGENSGLQPASQQSAPEIFVAQPRIQPPPAPVPLSQLPASAQDSSTNTFENNLSQSGPWIVYSTENGLWAVNEDGSGLSRLTSGQVSGPVNMEAAIGHDPSRIAYFTSSEPGLLQDLTLNVVTLPGGEITTIARLNSVLPNISVDAGMCDAVTEAARAPTIGNGLAWSPDGTKLAFSAALDGDTADVFIYSFDDDTITQITDEPGNAYDLHWSADQNKILYFSASCFGSGGGFAMEGVYTVDPLTGEHSLVYRPDEQSYGEEFVGWLFTDRAKFLAATVSGCPFRDMRLVDINTGEVSPLYDGCFEDYAVGPTSMLAVLTSRDMSEKPGVYLYAEPEYMFDPVYFTNQNGRQIEFAPGAMQFLIQNHEEGYKEIMSMDLEGKASWYIQRGEFPVFSMDGEHWVWEDQSEFYLGGNELETPQSLIKQPALYPIWLEILTSGVYRQQVLFSGSTPPYTLYRLVPGGALESVGEGMKPIAPPLKVFP